jgi:hypothetical protein
MIGCGFDEKIVRYRQQYAVTADRFGNKVQDIPTHEVQVGDRICVWLSDGVAYPTVTGWSDRELNLGYLGHPVHREFTVTGDVPWWLSQPEDTRGSLDGRVFVRALPQN